MDVKFLLVERFTLFEKHLCSQENLNLWKTSLIKEKSFLMENFLDQEKIFFCGKCPSSRKNLFFFGKPL